MSGKTDFFLFYQQLGLRPDCSLPELKNAYRRRVAELHPDRQRPGRADPEAAAHLQELTAAYNAAASFQRRYGRLPGATHTSARPVPAEGGRRPPLATAEVRAGGWYRALLAVLLLVTLAWILWGAAGVDGDGQVADPPVAGRIAAAAAAPGAGEAAAGSQRLELGMDAQAVRAIEGLPVMLSEERWDYGPSWIEFDHGRVSDWYSSKLRPLRTAQPRPRMH